MSRYIALPTDKTPSPASPLPALDARRRIAVIQAALLGVCATVSLPVLAARPMATDDAAIVAAGACQLEIWAERRRDERSAWLNPGCTPFGGTELSLGAALVRPDDAASFTVQQWQIKQLLRALDDTRAGLAVALGSHRVRQSDARDSFLNAIATLPLAGETRLLHLNMGALGACEDGRHRHRATWGVAFDAEVTPSTRASLESFGTSSERANWQFGASHELVPGRVQIDFSIGSVLGRRQDSRIVTLGVVLISPAFLR